MQNKTSAIVGLPDTEGLPPRPLKTYLGPDPSVDEVPLWSASKKLDELREYARSQRRERIAIRILAGFAANPHASTYCRGEQNLEQVAVSWAEDLMAELDK